MSMTSENGFCGEGESGGAEREVGRLPGRAPDDPAPGAILGRPGALGGPRADKVAAALTDYLRGRKAGRVPLTVPRVRGCLVSDQQGGCSTPAGTMATPGAGGVSRGSTGARAVAVGVGGPGMGNVEGPRFLREAKTPLTPARQSTIQAPGAAGRSQA